MVEIKQDELNKWNTHVLECYPNEAVGIVLDDGTIVLLENEHEEPTKHFKVPAQAYARYVPRMMAVLHSHTYKMDEVQLVDRRTPSARDIEIQRNTNVWWGICACEGESVSDLVWFGKDRNEPYEGREFFYNINDCFELVRDYYRRELKYEVPVVPREWDWFTHSALADDKFEEVGFAEVKIDEIRVNDMVHFAIADTKTNHVGVYLGDDKVLHHLANRLSGIDSLSKWYKHIHRVVRLKEKQE